MGAGEELPKYAGITPGNEASAPVDVPPAKTVDTARPRRKKPLPEVDVPLSKGVLAVDKELCSCCMNCVFACSLTKEGVGSFELSRLHMAAYSKYEFDAYAEPCMQCVEPLCLRICPTGAIGVDRASGTNARVIDQKKCIGCRKCMESCPYTPPRIIYDSAKLKALKCDLCGGDPACVKAYPSGALRYRTSPDGVVTGHMHLGGAR